MKDIYSRIDAILTGDATLRSLVGYKQNKDVPVGKEGLMSGVAEMTIRRGFQTEGNWSKLLTYYFQQESLAQDFSPDVREIPLVVTILDRISDLNLFDVSERVISLLDGADLSVANKVHVYDSSYAGQVQSPRWESTLKSYIMSIKFKIVARKEQQNA